MQDLPAPVFPGARLGAFEIEARLGRGGMGEVFAARDARLDRRVAIKVLPPDLARDGRSRSRFRREARLLASLNHPNIATVFGLQEESGVDFLVLELVEGRDLSRIIAGERPGVGEALRIARQIAAGIAAAHEAGVIHRDLKPPNVMVTGHGRVKVLDFGLAKPLRLHTGPFITASGTAPEHTTEGVLVGTPAYMSPERLEDREPDVRADVWSFGCVLFEMLTGRKAFGRRTIPATLAAVVAAQPDWTLLPPDTPEELGPLLARCLEKDPGARLADMGLALSEIDALLGESASAPSLRRAPRPIPSKRPSVAVLPFENVSGQPESDYFGHGLAEELIHELGRVPGLRVAARTSSFRVAGGRYDIREIGRRLGVEAVLEGSVRSFGPRMRITTRLVNCSDGFQLWSQRYDRSSSDLFEIQDEIASAIVEKLEVELTQSDQEPLVRRYTESLEAQTLFMKGRYYWDKRHEVGLTLSMQLFEQAIAADPDHVGAHVGLADAYWSIGGYLIRPPGEMFPKAEEAALQAVRIDDRHPGARMALAMVRYVFDWDWDDAEHQFRRSISLNPHASLPHGYYAMLLALRKRTDRALEEAERCRALDPFSTVAHGLASLSIGLTGRFNAAIPICLEGLEVEPDSYGDRWVLAWLYDRSGRHEEAVTVLRELTERFGRRGMLLPMLGHALGAAGREAEARQVLAELHEAASEDGRFVSPTFFAWVHQGLGEPRAAAGWMERAWEQRTNPNAFALYEGFASFLERIGLPP